MGTGTFHWTKERFIEATTSGLFGNAKAEFLGGKVYLMTPKRHTSVAGSTWSGCSRPY
jgi:hypothetical protein